MLFRQVTRVNQITNPIMAKTSLWQMNLLEFVSVPSCMKSTRHISRQASNATECEMHPEKERLHELLEMVFRYLPWDPTSRAFLDPGGLISSFLCALWTSKISLVVTQGDLSHSFRATAPLGWKRLLTQFFPRYLAGWGSTPVALSAQGIQAGESHGDPRSQGQPRPHILEFHLR